MQLFFQVFLPLSRQYWPFGIAAYATRAVAGSTHGRFLLAHVDIGGLCPAGNGDGQDCHYAFFHDLLRKIFLLLFVKGLI